MSENDSFKREHWNSKWDYILSVAGSFIGLGNIWRFPYLCFKHGGGAFLVPYFTFLFLAGIPIFYLEQSLGQLTQLGGIQAWGLVPSMKGIGYASVIICFLLNTYFTVILCWAVYYFVNSFITGKYSIEEQKVIESLPKNYTGRDPINLPYSTCGNDWNTECCVSINTQMMNTSSSSSLVPETCHKTVDASIEFWEKNVLNVSAHMFDGYYHMNWHLFLYLLICWIFVYFCLWKGVKQSGKVVWVTATAPFFLIIVFLIRGVTLPGAEIGINKYLSVNTTTLWSANVWNDAGTQIFWSFSICLSAHTSLGSYNKKSNNTLNQCIWLGLLNSFTSFVSGFVVFSVLGFMSLESNKTIEEVARGGPGLAFIAYPNAISAMPMARIWGIIFFTMIFFLGIDSQFVCTEGVITSICDIFPETFNTMTYISKSGQKTVKNKNNREKLVLFIAVASFLIGCFMITRNGIYILKIFDHYSASGMVLLIVAFFECVAIGYLYGFDKFYSEMEESLGYPPKFLGLKFKALTKLTWKYTAPVLCLVTLILNLVKFEHVDYTPDSFQTPVKYGPASIGLGLGLALMSVTCIPGYFIWYQIRGNGDALESPKF